MADGIYSITLNLDHPEWRTVWIVGDNCDEIRLKVNEDVVLYQPIINGSIVRCYLAENIEKVFYYDMIVESITRYEKK